MECNEPLTQVFLLLCVYCIKILLYLFYVDNFLNLIGMFYIYIVRILVPEHYKSFAYIKYYATYFAG